MTFFDAMIRYLSLYRTNAQASTTAAAFYLVVPLAEMPRPRSKASQNAPLAIDAISHFKYLLFEFSISNSHDKTPLAHF
jgi:hypothetical protein